ncbi:hypothetical protein BY458DRAFT_537037 [Sporodiniella umbellata]|nr:hypothetical protein BY458DRAFT_537037 [Sporodiniella umbellata]
MSSPEFELCVNDLVYPTEKAETLLETLSNEQLSLIEKAVNKIKCKKLSQEKEKQNQPKKLSYLSVHEPATEIREGVEWVSFVYSHHRTLRKYCIRTDLEKVETDSLDEKFKKENCVYPRANLAREAYHGNRWNYETECNVLGWKLAYLNQEELAGKRGLIQRAVDSYRNRYPSMRSRRVARQEKLLKGTLRKRKQREEEGHRPGKTTKYEHDKIPKTIVIEEKHGVKCRIRINIESVLLDTIDLDFKKANCVFPRAATLTPETPNLSQRRLEEIKCNEIGWKLAWLNPRQLANKKSLLQRALDIYRHEFTTDLKPRQFAPRFPPTALPLVEKAVPRRDSSDSRTTDTLDFHDYCLSLDDEEDPKENTLLQEFIAAAVAVSSHHQSEKQELDSLSESSTGPYPSLASPEALIHLTELYHKAFLPSATLFDPQHSLIKQESSVVNTDLLVKYEKNESLVTPSLLNQLY